MYLKDELYELIKTDESIFDFIQEGSLDGLWYWDLENPENEWMNARFWRVLGYDPDEMPHKSSAWQGIINQDDLKIASENFAKHCENPNHPYDQIVIYTHKNGSTIWIRCRGIAIRNKEGKAIRMLGAHQDISEIKRREQELAIANEKAVENEEKYLAFYNNSPLSYQSLDENGCFIDINPMWLKTLGYQREEVIGKWYGDFLHPDFIEHFRINFPEFKKHGCISDVQFKLRRKDNTYIYVSFEGCVGYTPDGKFKQTYCVFKDITEQKALENAMLKAKNKAEKSEERFNLAMQASNDGIFDWNLISNEIYYSPAWKKMLGYEEEELPNDFSVWEKTTKAEDVKKSWELQNKLINKEIDRFVIEFKMKHKEGHWIDVLSQAEAVFNDRGKAVRMVGTHTDITIRKQAELALKESEQRFRSLVNTLNSGVAFYKVINEGKTGSDYIIQSFNDFALKHEKLKKEDVLGKSLKEIRPEIDDYGLIDTFHQVWKTGEPALFPAKLYIDEKYANYYENRVFKISTGEIVAVYDDVTERERALIDLKEALEKAQESDRLKSAFLANMSHEIRTPMNGILGFAELLKKPDLAGYEQQKYINIIEKSGTRMLHIINDIVDISKIEAGLMAISMQKTNVNELIEDTYTFFKPEAETKGIKLSFKTALPAKEASIKTDREKLYAILTNLVINAVKYTREGFIEVGYDIVGVKNASTLQFYVRDSGIGIPKDRQAAIFELFIQADIDNRMAYQGAGLGLAITKAYVEMLGGKIRVKSEAGKGSTFYFTLPYDTGQTEETNGYQALVSEKNDDVRKLKILIAEDDEVSEMLLDETIRNFGKEVLKARTGAEAVELCRANPDIDLILMDIRMPEMGGYQATKQIRAFNREVIIIAQTAYGLTGDREQAIASGCSDYIAKPIKKVELEAMIQKCFATGSEDGKLASEKQTKQ